MGAKEVTRCLLRAWYMRARGRFETETCSQAEEGHAPVTRDDAGRAKVEKMMEPREVRQLISQALYDKVFQKLQVQAEGEAEETGVVAATGQEVEESKGGG